MVVPLGVGIGDVIEVAKLARSVITELKKNNEALPEYRALLLVLDLLAQLLDQIDQQTSKLKGAEHNIDQVELIQACCAACQDPLQKFLDKISKFEPSLGVWGKNGETLKGVRRRIQWKISYEDDVRELRTIFMGHNVRILLCQNIQIRESLCAAKTDRTENIRDLRTLFSESSPILNLLYPKTPDANNVPHWIRLLNASAKLSEWLMQMRQFFKIRVSILMGP